MLLAKNMRHLRIKIESLLINQNNFVHFDLDGTLLITEEAIIAAYKKAVAVYGGKWSEHAEYGLQSGLSSSEFLRHCSGFESKDIRRVQELKSLFYPQFFNKVIVNPKTLLLLQQVTPKAALVTNASRESTNSILQYFNLKKYFLHMITSTDLNKLKPSSEGYLKSRGLAELEFGLNLNHYAIEDSAIGKAAALNAGMIVLNPTLSF